MKKLLSFIEWKDYLDEYKDKNDFKISINELGLDGIEIVRCGYDSKIPKELIYGIHLPFFTSWVDYFNEDNSRVLEEFGSFDLAKNFYTKSPEKLYEYFLENMEYAKKYADYTVFHVANTTSLEYLNQKHHLTDEDVIDASAKLINKIILESKYDKLFLMENLYFPGLQFNDIKKTKRLLDQINYKNIGFMLDTGHLSNTNPYLKTEDQVWDYIEEVIDKHSELIDYFKGVHLQISVSGQEALRLKENPPKMKVDFYERFEQIYNVVENIDTHSIVKSTKAKRVLEKINPEYLVLEFKSDSRVDREEKIKKQLSIL